MNGSKIKNDKDEREAVVQSLISCGADPSDSMVNEVVYRIKASSLYGLESLGVTIDKAVDDVLRDLPVIMWRKN